MILGTLSDGMKLMPNILFCIKFIKLSLTPAGGHLAAPHRQRGVEAGELRLALQVVTHVTVEAGGASWEQVQHGHLPVVRPLR